MLRAALKALERTFCNSNIGHLNTDLIFASLNQNKTGDDIEKEALAQFFGHKMPAVKCVKSLLGDSLGASGGLQVAAAAISIKAGVKAVSKQNVCDTKPVEQVLVSSFSDEGHMSFLLLRKPKG